MSSYLTQSNSLHGRSLHCGEFFTGTVWQPQILKFGIFPLFSATMLTTLIGMTVALPIGLMIAIYLSEYASESGARYLEANP